MPFLPPYLSSQLSKAQTPFYFLYFNNAKSRLLFLTAIITLANAILCLLSFCNLQSSFLFSVNYPYSIVHLFSNTLYYLLSVLLWPQLWYAPSPSLLLDSPTFFLILIFLQSCLFQVSFVSVGIIILWLLLSTINIVNNVLQSSLLFSLKWKSLSLFTGIMTKDNVSISTTYVYLPLIKHTSYY